MESKAKYAAKSQFISRLNGRKSIVKKGKMTSRKRQGKVARKHEWKQKKRKHGISSRVQLAKVCERQGNQSKVFVALLPLEKLRFENIQHVTSCLSLLRHKH